MLRFSKLATFIFATLGLQYCSSIAPPAVENVVWDSQRQLLEDLEQWQLRGRVNVVYEGESYTPNIRWQHEQRDYSIRLWGTLNAGNTRINGRPGAVSMERGGDIFTAPSPEQLILQQLGYELPVSYLEYWIRGLPAPSSRADLNFNELNQLAGMEQDGWIVSYPDPRQYGELTLPRRVDVSRPLDDVRLRFFRLNWTVDQAEN